MSTFTQEPAHHREFLCHVCFFCLGAHPMPRIPSRGNCQRGPLPAAAHILVLTPSPPKLLLALLSLINVSSLLPTCVPLFGWSLTSPQHCSEGPLGKGKAWRAWCWGTPCPGCDRGPAAPSSVEHTPRPSASAEWSGEGLSLLRALIYRALAVCRALLAYGSFDSSNSLPRHRGLHFLSY